MANQNFDFEILIDDSFSNLVETELTPTENKHVLSLINDFENGEWRYSKFQNFIWDNIAETALSLKERQCLIGQHQTILTACAKNLRLADNDVGGGGSELAEILLYGIMRHHYKALPVVPKIFHKQNVQDFAKGADSVHIVIENENDFSLWFGEAKFYDSIEDVRLYPIINSVENSLSVDKLKKENSIITNISDLDDAISDITLRNNIKNTLKQSESIDNIKPKLHIPILLLHECEITKEYNSLTDDYKRRLIEHHKDRAISYFTKQINKLKELHKYSEIKFHIILFPVPSKSNIVEKFIANTQHHKNQ